MNDLETKRGIENSLKSFADKPMVDAAAALFESLGYKSQKRIVLKPNTAETFVATFAKDKPLNPDNALLADWQSVDFLFQLTDEEVHAAAQGNQQFLFDSKGKWNGAAIESYLFFAITLAKPHYTRTELSGVTRAVNRLFPMPAMLLFRHGDTLTLAVINRRLHKRDESRDVLEKVTLIKDIRFANPHRAHVEILADLSFDALHEKHGFSNFVALQAAWQKALDSSELNKRFFLEVANWYFWALHHIEFPKDAPKQDGKDHISVIRLITRLMFCWFIKEKGLVPDVLFDERKLPQILNGFAPNGEADNPVCSKGGKQAGQTGLPASHKESVFYRAILQNLFFATLNTEMDKRDWANDKQNFMAHSLYRFRESFQKPADALDLFNNIPFLNGGLFECLDKDLGENAKPRYTRIDGFSRREDSQVVAPDFLFFGPECDVDLSAEYGDKKFKKVKVRGLIHTLNHYKFTVAENTPIEEEIALDPELSGKVFENLLAAYNPETGATARKQTGSFYTPREIVNYMVDEALIACLQSKLVGDDVRSLTSLESKAGGKDKLESPHVVSYEQKLRHLFAYNDEPHQFTAPEVDALIAAIDSLKSLDPAVGSGAFPMGILHKLVFILGKLDPRNEKWKERQIARVRDAMATAEKIDDATVRERAVRELEQQITGINEAFEHNELDYGRKLYLIENCIYGVDIQPIAVQIAKMRFFISLIVDQKIDDTQPNRGVRPLPNLETKFVAANTLIGVNRPGQQLLRNRDIDAKEAKLREVRRSHFLARSLTQKKKCREQDEKLRAEIAELLKGDGWDKDTATKLASWNPYDQNASADFFDAEWMFGITDGFDTAIGNPPYVRADEQSEWNQRQREQILATKKYETLWEKWDLFVPFIERAFKLLKPGGVTTLIVSDAFCHSKYAQKAQNWFLKSARILRLDFCAGLQIFDAAVHNLIYLFQRADGTSHTPVRRMHFETFGNVSTLPSDEQAKLTYRAFFPEDRVAGTFTCAAVALADISYISKGMVVHADEREARGAFELRDLVSDRKDKVHPRSFVEGKHLDRWLPTERKWLEWGTARAPALFSRPTFPELYTVPEKIFIHRTAGEEVRSCHDSEQTLCNHTVMVSVAWHALHGVRNNSLKKAARYRGEKPPRPDLPNREELEAASRRFAVKYLLAVMNSSAARDFLRANRRSNTDLYPDDWKKLPIPDVPPAKQQPIVALVDQILTAKQQNPAADTSALEREIDQQVYALYGLTPVEIKIVEAASK